MIKRILAGTVGILVFLCFLTAMTTGISVTGGAPITQETLAISLLSVFMLLGGLAIVFGVLFGVPALLVYGFSGVTDDDYGDDWDY